MDGGREHNGLEAAAAAFPHDAAGMREVGGQHQLTRHRVSLDELAASRRGPRRIVAELAAPPGSATCTVRCMRSPEKTALPALVRSRTPTWPGVCPIQGS